VWLPGALTATISTTAQKKGFATRSKSHKIALILLLDPKALSRLS